MVQAILSKNSQYSFAFLLHFLKKGRLPLYQVVESFRPAMARDVYKRQMQDLPLEQGQSLALLYLYNLYYEMGFYDMQVAYKLGLDHRLYQRLRACLLYTSRGRIRTPRRRRARCPDRWHRYTRGQGARQYPGERPAARPAPCRTVRRGPAPRLSLIHIFSVNLRRIRRSVSSVGVLLNLFLPFARRGF